MAEYNGHKNYDYWNVALWISSDYGLYTFAMQRIAAHSRLMDSAKDIVNQLRRAGCAETPDGSKYTIRNVYQAIRYFRD